MAQGDRRYRTVDGMDIEFISQGVRTVDGQTRDIWRPAVDAGNKALNAEPSIVAGQTITVGVDLTRPADVLAYTALDVVSNSTTAGAVLNLTNLARKANGSGYITKIRLLTNQSSNTARFRLHLFELTPNVSTIRNDNVPFTQLYANRDKAIGIVDMPAMGTEAIGSDSARTMNADVRLAFAGTADANIYAILQTLDAFTPVSQQQFYIEVTAEQN